MAVIAGLLVGAKALGLEHMFDTAWIDHEIRSRGAWGHVLFMAVFSLLIAAGLPRAVPSFLGGYAFGAALGSLWTMVASALGLTVCFLFARYLGRDLVVSRFERRIRAINLFLSRHPFGTAIAVRLMPLGNNLMTNLLAGISDARLGPFLAGSCVGYIPQTLIFALLGSGVRVDPVVRTALAAALFVAASWLGLVLIRRFRRLARDAGQEFPET